MSHLFTQTQAFQSLIIHEVSVYALAIGFSFYSTAQWKDTRHYLLCVSIKSCFVPYDVTKFGKIPCADEKNVNSLCVEWDILYISIKSS